ncbi:nitroreductase family protein [Paremcibacter congregatus]|uniref:Putative NAD(P)H nitroreductase n=1 Tax=Paremcibacter congregatus TaxID=2043170 RepID=A0A2G4YUI9_9PROT|nr:nitroreductase [Paremcibacter congregatus]PHZ85953.1 nitroreductase [Paremcibacter congregatus]QDE26918.1 nitroreductase [Paremcibacter congregatus]|tara:strand:+ start:2755 stop:3324 length:570 start_codon:yes stop_codon:yes gene_type:complete
MSVIDAIKARNSIPFLTDEDIPREMITEILDAAVCTPVHYCTDPWRFLVIRGEGRHRFGDFMAERMKKTLPDPDCPDNAAFLDKIRKKPLRAPVIIAVGAAKPDTPKALHMEDVASANVACQNILLAAGELGLGGIWRTGGLTYGEDTVAFLGFEADTRLVGFIYLGYPKRDLPPKERKTAESFTRYME